MLVHHDMWFRDLYAKAFNSFGIATTEADSGQACVNALDAAQADVVVVGLGLPGHNGIEVLHEMQSYPDWQGLPIVALSARRQAEYHVDPEVWRNHGVHDFVYMPDVKPEQLVARVRALVS